MRRGVGEQRNDLEEARERIRKSVREHQRHRPRAAAALVDEVDVGGSRRRRVLREALSRSLPARASRNASRQ